MEHLTSYKCSSILLAYNSSQLQYLVQIKNILWNKIDNEEKKCNYVLGFLQSVSFKYCSETVLTNTQTLFFSVFTYSV